MAGDEMANLGGAVDEDKDAVESAGDGQVGDEVETNRRKRMVRNRKRLHEASRLLTRSLGTRSGIARTNVRLDKKDQARPPIVAFDEIQGVGCTEMA